MLTTVLLIVLVVIVVGALPNAPWGSFHPYGLYPSGLAGVVLIILLIVLLTGRL
jgi:hypothetical protein